MECDLLNSAICRDSRERSFQLADTYLRNTTDISPMKLITTIV